MHKLITTNKKQYRNLILKIYNSVLLCILCSTAIHHAMEITSLPDDILATIFKFSHPSIDLLHNKVAYYQGKTPPVNSSHFNEYFNTAGTNVILRKTKMIAETLINLRSINKQFNTFISRNINTYLGLNKNNINAFLIRATLAHVPYFMNIALPIKLNQDIMADPNCINEEDGFTPLLYATTHEHYPTCKLLIEKGADVNVRGYPKHIDFDLDPQQQSIPFLYPIGVAINNGSTRILSLLLENGAHLDKYIYIKNNSYGSALHVANKNNNPYTIALLLNANAGKNKGGIHYWLNRNLCKQGTIDVENALKILIEHNAQAKQTNYPWTFL